MWLHGPTGTDPARTVTARGTTRRNGGSVHHPPSPEFPAAARPVRPTLFRIPLRQRPAGAAARTPNEVCCMTAAAVGPTTLIPTPRPASDDSGTAGAGPRPDPAAGRAVAYQRVLHQLVRRELRLLADLAGWAPSDEAERTLTLARHAELIGRVLLHHHAVERDAVWPALLRAVPADRTDEIRAARRRRGRRLRADRPHAARRGDRRPPVAGRPARASPATPSRGRAAPWPTPSTRRPPRRSARCCRCSVEHLRGGRLGGDRRLVALPAVGARAVAGAGPGARGLLRRPTGPDCWRGSPGRRAWPGG